jgi:predicted adenylyl cyclase CyaB
VTSAEAGGGPRRNVEVKARCPDLDAARATARRLGATPAARVRQVDTYFRVPEGRLKLRRAEPGAAELIFYRRPDAAAGKVSEYCRAPVTDSDALRPVLAAALGVRVEVIKVRELWLLGNVRIHLDEVEGLGTFLEFEAVVGGPYSETDGRAEVGELTAAFALRGSDLIAGSYADALSTG